MHYLFLTVILVVGGFYFYTKNPDFFSGFYSNSQTFVEELPSEQDLREKISEIQLEMRALKDNLVQAKQDGEAKLEEIQEKIVEAEKAFRDTKQALEDLQKAGEDLRGVLD